MKLNKTKMPNVLPSERANNFNEVACGYDFDSAEMEATRCLQCKNPRCVSACPVNINIPKFIDHIVNREWEEAYYAISEDNILPSICGRVCPQEKQCEGACVVGIKGESVAIGALERAVGDYAIINDLNRVMPVRENTGKVAIVGSGPAGLACAYEIRLLGYTVTVYEALHKFGGVLQYGIPDFRLPKSIVNNEIERLEKLGVMFKKNILVGKTITIDQLKSNLEYDAVFIGAGAGLPISLNIPGENFAGVYYANEFLTRVNLMRAMEFPHAVTPIRTGEKVFVIGGGNVAMDAARTAKRIGAKEVVVLYRRDREAMPARREEIIHATEEGVSFAFLRSPVKIEGKGYRVKKIVCEKMILGKPDQSNRRRPIPTNTYETYQADTVIIAIGQRPNPILSRHTKGLKTDMKGYVIVDETYQTTLPGVFAGGDVVSGAGTVIHAMGQGKKAAHFIHEYLIQKKKIDTDK